MKFSRHGVFVPGICEPLEYYDFRLILKKESARYGLN